MAEAIQVEPLEVPQVRLARLRAVQLKEFQRPAHPDFVPSPLRQIHVRSIEEALAAIAFGLGDASEFGFPLVRAHLFQPGLFGCGKERLVLDGLGGGDAGAHDQ